MIRLRTLGRFDLVRDGPDCAAQPVPVQPKRLALLAYLAMATPRGLHRRDVLLGLFWPELDQTEARAALRQALHDVRRYIGGAAIVSSTDQVGLAEGWDCDAVTFERALDEGRSADALTLYQGDFLAGVHLADVAPEFEQWIDRAQTGLRLRAADAAKALATTRHRAGDHAQAVVWAESAARLAPDDESTVRLLMQALAAGGERARALVVYAQFAARLEEEYGARPAPATEETMAALRDARVGPLPERALPDPVPPVAPAAPDRAATVVPIAPDRAAGVVPATADHPAAAAVPAVPSSRISTRPTQRWPLAVVAIVVMAAAVSVERMTRTPPPLGQASLAVLPFEMQGDTADAVFVDGVADEIRGKLLTLPDLRIIASGSSNYYRHTHERLEIVARELGVRYVLTGTVQVERRPGAPPRVHVRPELAEVLSEGAPETRWAGSFDTTLADVFAVQATVANRVAERLGVLLPPAAESILREPPTQNLAAYDAYLRSFPSRNDEETELGFSGPALPRRLAGHAEQAVALDSTFAAAWAQLSGLKGVVASDEVGAAFARDTMAARQAADRAIVLAPNAPEGHLARAFYMLRFNQNRAAYTEFALVRRLAPSSVDALTGLAATTVWLGNRDAVALDSCVRLARQAVVLNPRDPTAAQILAEALLDLRRYAETRTEARRALRFHPNEGVFYVFLKYSYLGEGDLPHAQAVFRELPAGADRAHFIRLAPAWPLDSADRTLLATLPVSMYDGDSAEWASHRAELAWLRGDTVTVRAMARVALRAVPREDTMGSGTDHFRELERLRALGYLGDRAGVAREVARWKARDSTDGENGAYTGDPLTPIYLALDDRARAIDQLARVLANPYYISRATVRMDPTWDRLRGDPGFEQLIAEH